jgi:hypothetical protein
MQKLSTQINRAIEQLQCSQELGKKREDRDARWRFCEYAELFLSDPLYVKMSGLCPRIDYRPQWGNDGKIPIHLGCHYTTHPLKRQCLVRQALRPFDKLRASSAQDRPTTSGSTSSPQAVRQAVRWCTSLPVLPVADP